MHAARAAATAAIGGLLAIGTAAHPQEQPPRPTFRSAVDLVPVDVNVIDKDGRPVDNLSAADFTLTVDGKPRTLASAQFISIRRSDDTAPPVAHYSTNAGAVGGRLVAIVVDAGHIASGRGRAAMDAASRFIERLNPADRVALAVIPGAGWQVEFTSNHALVQGALPKIVGQATAPAPSSTVNVGIGEALAIERGDESSVAKTVARECPTDLTPDVRAGCIQSIQQEAATRLSDFRERAGRSLMSLRALFDHLSSSDTPKTVLFISEGLVVDRDYKELAWIGPRSAAAHITLYVLQLDTPDLDAGTRRGMVTRSEDQDVLREGLDVMAGLARGDVFRVVANPDFAFQRVALEMSGYYLLSFEPQAGDRDGSPHKIRIDTSRKGVQVRARREFAVAPSVAKTNADVLAETLRSPLLVSDIPVTLTTYTFQDPESSRLKVFLAAEIDRSLNLDTPMALGYALTDDKGKAVASRLETNVTTPVRRDTKAQSYVGAAVVPPGLYTLKLAVVDETGKRGSVERTFTARISTFGQIHVTDLLIADNSAPAAGSGLAPATTARFSGEELHAYVELFSEAPEQLQDVTVAIEVARSEDDRALDAVPANFQRVSSGGERRRAAEASVPIALMPPDDYVARAVLSIAGRKIGQVSRPFTIKRAATSFVTLGSAAVPKAAAASFTTRIDAFDIESVLTPAVVGFFLDRVGAASGDAVSTTPLATNAARAGRFDEVIAATATGEQPATLFLNGLGLLSRKEIGAAAERFRTALAGDSAFVPAIFYLGSCFAAVGRDRDAAGAWESLLAGNARAPFIYTLLGDALLRQREIGRAVTVLTEARTLWPNDDQVTIRLATALAMDAKGADALKILDPYLASHPSDHERLFIALRALYDARVAGRAITTPDEDRARFMRYADAYAKANGPQTALVEQWKQFIARP